MKFNKRNTIVRICCFVIINLITTGFLCAQNTKRFDSILKVASNQMYINPDIVIKSGLIIVNESGKNIDYKIMEYLNLEII